MSRISNLTKYPYDYNITEKDFVIGTNGDTNNKKTKNFPVVALAEYVRNFNNNLSYDRVISIGEITSENNNITINVNDLGNVVYINHTFYTKNTPDTFTFTPVTEGVKIILLYALPDEQIFYMLEGVQSIEAVEPTLPSGALFVQRIIVTVDGIEIIPNDIIISDNKVQITENTPFANIGQTQKDFNKNITDEVISLTDSIEITKTELDVLISENKLEPNRLYKITGVESWCFSQHLIKAIYLKAITNNILESEGVGEFYTPKYNELDSNLGIWKGELLVNGMIDSASYNIGDKVIWGNLFWENISGQIGNNNYVFEGDDYQLNNYLSETDWQLITPNDDESLYSIQFCLIKYDLENDYINYREDDLGNKYELSYNTLLEIFSTSWIIDLFPEFIYNINSIALFQWGIHSVLNNNINESIVLNCNYNTSFFKNNIILEKSIIERNSLLGASFIDNKLIHSLVRSNYIKTFGGIINNILNNSEISSNRYYIEISGNNLANNSQINSNNDNDIIVNNKYTIIKDNILNNNCKINSNTFVEEGNEVDGTIKSIYGNELINNSTINNNTIKNGSRIFGHRLEYFSSINGNTLDTESNIYNNQLIQESKIDNNILTGHGRIYGNQLDRASEITLCKLRIYPTSSYASEIHSSRLFGGKIQNVDFGDIVNPVGTNPNNPAFGGNTLSSCIVENGSIIKDLIFPNTGGKAIQFVKMNGFSEFKNITVNDSIRNVDFINTIFNETSDYSKLIEGSGYQTNGFTKTYIDGVLLQDRFNAETLDVITDRGNTTENDITVGGITTNYVQLDTTSANTYNIGKVYWNEAKGTYNFGLKNNVELQLGQEQHVYGKAYSAISNGQLVMYRTSQDGHILFEPANFAQLSANPDLIIGVATQDIALNDFGYITTFGEVNTLNTSSFSDGNTLYFGSGNVLQNTVPSGSYFIVGRVNRSHATQGIIFVKPYFVDSTKISGTVTANYIPKSTASGTIGNSIIYETNNKIGINSTPSDTLDIKTVGQGSIRFGGANGRTISAYNSTGTLMNIDFASGATFLGNLYGSNIFDFATNKQSVRLSSTDITFWSNSLQRLTLDINGNIGIGTSPIEKLDVNGNVLVQGLLKLKPQTSAPTGVEGAIYYNSTTKKHYGFDGTTWNALY